MAKGTVTAYPLSWPVHFPRTTAREASRFKATLAGALRHVQDSLRLFANDSGKKLTDLVISSNYSLGVENPVDPGVAAYFTWDGLQVCIPVDRYRTLAENLQAIHHVIEARRVELRHGTLALVRASFSGFAALPPPTGSRPWRDVLDIKGPATREIVDAAYRRLAREHHPDQGGDHDAMSELNVAKEQALREVA